MTRTAFDQPIVFFGMGSYLSRSVLAHLISKKWNIQAIVRAISPYTKNKPPNFFRFHEGLAKKIQTLLDTLPSPIEQSPLLHLAHKNKIDYVEVWDVNHPSMQTFLKSIQPELILIVNFTHLLSAETLSIPSNAIINVHPSLLPNYRGPSPLFWMMKHGETDFGVTIHLVDEKEDHGDILYQEKFSIPVGITFQELDHALTNMVVNNIENILQNIFNKTSTCFPQTTVQHTRHSRPKYDDFALDTSLPADKVFTFITSMHSVYQLYVKINQEKFEIDTPVGYDPNEVFPYDYFLQGNSLIFRCNPGTVEVQLKSMQ